MLRKFRLNSNKKGFTLIELMIVIAIIGILAAIAIPNFLAYRQRGYDGSAKTDIKNAYTAAQAYFSDWSSADMTQEKLEIGGFRSTQNVDLLFNNGTMKELNFTTQHKQGAKIFTIDDAGKITEEDVD